MIDTPVNPTSSFWLDIVDKLIKLIAVFIGGLWTWWNYRKSRTYEQRLELVVSGNVFARGDLYGDLRVVVKNIGASKHTVASAGTSCELFAIWSDMSENSVDIFHVFALNDRIEPGESIADTRTWHIPGPINDILWIKLALRVVSNGLEWNSSCLIRVEHEVDSTEVA